MRLQVKVRSYWNVRIKALLSFSLIALMHVSTSAQTINLDEIVRMRSMDSTELKTFSEERGFKLQGISKGPGRLIHRYHFPKDSSMWFVRSFPVDSTRNKHVYFYFGDVALNKLLKKQIGQQGYKFESREESEHHGNVTRRDIFLKDGMEIILAYESVANRPKRYVLMYQRQFKMYKLTSPKYQ